MSSNFRMDPNWEREVLRSADGHLRKVSSDLQRAMDRLRPAYVGKPVAEIKPVLQRAWRSATVDGKIADPELSEYAKAISSGRQIKFRYKGVN